MMMEMKYNEQIYKKKKKINKKSLPLHGLVENVQICRTYYPLPWHLVFSLFFPLTL